MNALNDLFYSAFQDLISLMLSLPVSILSDVLIAVVTSLLGLA